MYRTKIVAFFLALAIGACSGSDECELPTKSQLEDVIGLIIQAGDNAAAPDVELIDFEIVCSAFGEQEGLLRQVSVVVEYTCTGHGNCPSDTATEQIESQCNGGNWTNVVGGSTDDVRLRSPIATLTTPGRDDCAFCLSPDKAESVEINAPAPDTVTHCVACNSSCEGLGRCSGLDDSDCCNYYNNSLCVDVCPTPFTPNSDNDCVCPEGTTGFNCNELVDCGNLTAPDNGEVTLLTGTVFNSSATYSCDPGYVLYGDATRICLVDGSWSGNEPTCEDCGGLSDPLNGMVSLTGTVLGSTATYACNAGYTLIGEDTRTCESDGEWSGEEPTCTECTVPGCLTCDKPEVCIECEENYELANDICKQVSSSPSPGGGEECTQTNILAALIAVAVVSLLIIVTLIIVILIQCLLILRKDKKQETDVTVHKADIPVSPNEAYNIHMGRKTKSCEEATYEAMM